MVGLELSRTAKYCADEVACYRRRLELWAQDLFDMLPRRMQIAITVVFCVAVPLILVLVLVLLEDISPWVVRSYGAAMGGMQPCRDFWWHA